MKKILLTIVMVLVAANAFGADVKKEIVARNKAWTDAFNRGDLKSVSAIYGEGFIAIPSGGEAISDRAEFEKLLGTLLQVAADLKFETLSVDVMDNYAYELGRAHYVVTAENGDKAKISDRYFVIWKKGADGVWYYHVDAWWTAN